MTTGELTRIAECLWELPRTAKMRAPARIYAAEKMLPQILADEAAQQVMNVACLPGIVGASLAMPDIHWGYGFPIGGVAAFDLEEGVISPGGVGYDINCGVRLMASGLTAGELKPHLGKLVNRLFACVPSGVGARGPLRVSDREMDDVARQGSPWMIAHGFGEESDVEFTEENGRMAGADPERVSAHARERGRGQLGTLGSGNHFLELGQVAEIYDEEAARVLGLALGQVTVIIHCGSRGFGHQVCDDYLALMDEAARKYRIELPDRQLACAPCASPEGRAYLGAMRCAVNFAFANRQAIAHRVREAFQREIGTGGNAGLRTVYEVAHNIAKLETHPVGGVERELCVHRKGATRAFAAGRSEVPAAYRRIGQPVLIPGDMGRYSYVLTGTDKAMAETFGSTCHGAGRAMSRHRALAAARGRDIVGEMKARGVVVRGASRRTVDEELPEAYKDVAEVVDVCQRAGISRKVAQLRPIACIKG